MELLIPTQTCAIYDARIELNPPGHFMLFVRKYFPIANPEDTVVLLSERTGKTLNFMHGIRTNGSHFTPPLWDWIKAQTPAYIGNDIGAVWTQRIYGYPTSIEPFYVHVLLLDT